MRMERYASVHSDIQQIYIFARMCLRKEVLTTTRLWFSSVSQILSAFLWSLLSFAVYFNDMVIKGVHANTSARIDSVTSAVITNELRRKSNEWVFYEFRGDRSRKERKTRRTSTGEEDNEEGRAGCHGEPLWPEYTRAELLKRYFVWIFRALRNLKTWFDGVYIVIYSVVKSRSIEKILKRIYYKKVISNWSY